MYFITQGGRVYHVLSDERAGAAPCGARLSRLDLLCLERQWPTRNVLAEKPEEAPLCKQCERMEEVV
jgi:hypothetical protein